MHKVHEEQRPSVQELVQGCVLKAKDCIQRHQEGLDRLLVEHNKLLAQVVHVVNVENCNELDTAVVARVPQVVDLDAQSDPPSFDTKFGLCRSQSHLSSNPRHTPEFPARYSQGLSRERSETKHAYHHMMETLPTTVVDPFSKAMGRITFNARQRQQETHHTALGRLRRCLQSSMWQGLISVVILVQGAVIAAMSNASAMLAFQNWDGKSMGTIEATEYVIEQLSYVDVGVTCIFSVELVARLLCESSLFFIGTDWKWNLLDLVLVVSAAMELLVIVSISIVDVSFFRILRILRAFRTLRIFRMFRMFGGLRLMVDAIFTSMLPLIWTSIFLAILIFVFAVLFQLAVTNRLTGASLNDDLFIESLRPHFENLALTMLTLFMSITSGISWWEIVQLLLEIERPWYGLLFVAYISVMFIFVLNIITGVLVNNVVESARDEKEAEKEQRSIYLTELRQLWKEIDTEDTGTLGREAFQEALNSPNVQEKFERLNVDLTDCAAFFESLDEDGDGNVELEEFVVGLMRAAFKSNMVDAHTLLRENRKAKRQASKLARDTQEHLSQIRRVLTQISTDQQKLRWVVERRSGPDISARYAPS